MKERLLLIFLASLALSCLPALADELLPPGPDSAKELRNVIVMIPDGCSVTACTLARWYKGAPLCLDPYASGLVRTYSAESAITDSAPAATAYACGFKSNDDYVGVLPTKAGMPGVEPPAAGDGGKPVPNVAEAARLSGRSVGIVATCEIMHATPASFSAHLISRKDYDDIFEQQIFSGFDVFLGGGSKFLKPESRADKEDMAAAIEEEGYELVTDSAGLSACEARKVFGLFAPVHMDYDFDRAPALQPSLAEMTRKALALLSRNPKGFFLMVEGSKVDWSAHANEPVGVVSEMLAFDAAFKEALDFARKDGSTAIVVCADHGTGGISIGERSLGVNYASSPLELFMKDLKAAKRTGEGLALAMRPDMDRAEVAESVGSLYGLKDLKDSELDAICKAVAASSKNLSNLVGPMMSVRSHIGWTSGGHTGEDVALFSIAPGGRPSGTLENTEICAWVSRWLGADLANLRNELFSEAKPLFESKGAQVSEDCPEPGNPVLVAVKGGHELRIPVNRSYGFLDGRKSRLGGVAVRAEGRWYLPRSAVGLLD